jgi:polysaccharide deacetylase family protein (PEP-CTERM system associated)
LFEEQGVKATFFVLGYNAERYPHLVKMIQEGGHELGTHGYSHKLVYTQTPAEFREEMKRTIGVVEELGGERVIGHRAAAFSITPRSIWAFDVLLELGIRYDSSIFPVRHYRYGWPGAPERFCRIKRAGGSIVEFPMPTWRLGKLRLPVGGGAYQRIFPRFTPY